MTTDNTRTLKPKLTIDEQIEHLKAKGVIFERCTESEAAAYLTDVNYYFRVTAYRSLFEKRVGGAHDGEYVNLDFADLIDLAVLDRHLRNLMFPITVAVEHAAKTRNMANVTDRQNEDGYAIMDDYWRSLSEESLALRKKEFARFAGAEYSGDIVAKYPADIPVWLFLEFSSFGAFTNFYRFCALRWADDEMLDVHYALRQCVTLRNACGHGLPIINGFTHRKGSVRVNKKVADAAATLGFSKRVRSEKLKNPRVQQIITALYLYAKTFDLDDSDGDLRKEPDCFETRVRSFIDALPRNNASDVLRSFFEFLLAAFDKWL